jgi:hypothetical protein
VPSLNVPVAVNCAVEPAAAVGVVVVTAIDVNCTGPTVMFAVPLTPPVAAAAVTVHPPVATVVAFPPLVIVSTLEFEEVQVTFPVTSFVVPSEYVPAALNCFFSPSAIVALPGITLIELRRELPTASVVVLEIAAELALIVELPGTRALASPGVPETLMVATAGLDEVQVTVAVISRVLPSENLPLAVNFCVRPAATEGLAGLICREDRTGCPVPPPAPPIAPPLPQPASKQIEANRPDSNSFPINSRRWRNSEDEGGTARQFGTDVNSSNMLGRSRPCQDAKSCAYASAAKWASTQLMKRRGGVAERI